MYMFVPPRSRIRENSHPLGGYSGDRNSGGDIIATLPVVIPPAYPTYPRSCIFAVNINVHFYQYNVI